MKLAVATVLALLSCSPAFAITYEVIGACSPEPAYSGSLETTAPISAGKASIEIFDRDHIPYDGSESGMRSILNTPTGDDALEVISNTEMRAYGWCYEVDGVQSGDMPDQVMLKGTEHLKWFYAYALYKGGKWLEYCTPAYTVKPKKICK